MFCTLGGPHCSGGRWPNRGRSGVSLSLSLSLSPSLSFLLRSCASVEKCGMRAVVVYVNTVDSK